MLMSLLFSLLCLYVFVSETRVWRFWRRKFNFGNENQGIDIPGLWLRERERRVALLSRDVSSGGKRMIVSPFRVCVYVYLFFPSSLLQTPALALLYVGEWSRPRRRCGYVKRPLSYRRQNTDRTQKKQKKKPTSTHTQQKPSRNRHATSKKPSKRTANISTIANTTKSPGSGEENEPRRNERHPKETKKSRWRRKPQSSRVRAGRAERKRNNRRRARKGRNRGPNEEDWKTRTYP